MANSTNPGRRSNRSANPDGGGLAEAQRGSEEAHGENARERGVPSGTGGANARVRMRARGRQAEPETEEGATGNETGSPESRDKRRGKSAAGGKWRDGNRPAAADPPVRPVAGPARMHRRHRALIALVLIGLLAPLLVTTVYLYGFAKDQYASTVGFTIRQEEAGSASDLLGGLSSMIGGNTRGDADLLNEFIQSQEIVERIMQDIDLPGHYSQNWPADPIFSIWPNATIEDMLWFWGRVVRISFDRSTGLIDVQVRAGDPETARDIARAIVSESEAMINALNEAARRDAMSHAQRDLDEALARLRAAREELAAFRARTRIVDPQADIQGRMGVLNNLQQQLAEALVDYDLLLQVTNESDPRVRQAVRRIEVIRDRIDQERLTFATADVTVDDTDYPSLLAQFESLAVDAEFAQQSYTAALTALDAARSNAMRQSLYLATYIRPTLAQRAEYPQRLLLVILTFFFLVLIWAVVALVYYSLRDRG